MRLEALEHLFLMSLMSANRSQRGMRAMAKRRDERGCDCFRLNSGNRSTTEERTPTLPFPTPARLVCWYSLSTCLLPRVALSSRSTKCSICVYSPAIWFSRTVGRAARAVWLKLSQERPGGEGPRVFNAIASNFALSGSPK
jgi:hypothetical protein